MAHKEFGVVGLGKFGLSLASSLMAHGQKVVGVDSDPDKVKAAAELLTQVYQAEAVDKTALEQLGFGELLSYQVRLHFGQGQVPRRRPHGIQLQERPRKGPRSCAHGH